MHSLFRKILFFFFIIQTSMAQVKETIYFDTEWEETTKDQAEYYRNLPLEVKGDEVLVKDYYISGKIQMIGWAEKGDEGSFHGEVKWFYKNGNVERISNFRYGNLNGVHKEFYENGNARMVANYEDNYKEGEVQFFNIDGQLTSTAVYKNDQPFDGTTDCFSTYKNGENIKRALYFENTGQLAYQRLVVDHIVKETYFDKDGKLLREISMDLRLKDQDGFSGSFYPGSSCGFVTSIQHFQNIKKGKLEGNESFYHPDGSVLYTGINKEGKPYEGTFLKFKRGTKHISTYQAGTLIEKEIQFDDQTIAKGTFVDGQAYEGTFISKAEVHGWACRKFSHLKAGKEEGKQSFKRLDETEPFAYYYAHNGLKDGENYDYDLEERASYLMIYKKGEPFEGSLLDQNRNILIYQKGKLEKKKVRAKSRDFNFFKIYENDQKVGVEYSFFEIDGETKQKGIYRDNLPYQGYFLNPLFEFPILDYYENGIKKHQYSEGIFGGDTQEIDHLAIPFKSDYKNGEIYQGTQYNQLNNHSISIKVLDKGRVNAISLWVFAIHYANNVILERTDEGMKISEVQHPKLTIMVDQNFIYLKYEEEIIDTRKRNSKELINKNFTFYFEEGNLKSDSYWGFSSDAKAKISKIEDHLFKSDFILDIYLTLPSINTIESTFKRFDSAYVRPGNNKDYVANISYNEKGEPSQGFLIQKNGKLFDLQLYLQNELKESVSQLTIDKLKESIQIWEEKYSR